MERRAGRHQLTGKSCCGPRERRWLMGMKLNLGAGHVEEQVVINERLCLTKEEDRVVSDTDPDAYYLWATPGQSVSKADAERLGALKPKTAPVKPEEKPSEDSKEAEEEQAPSKEAEEEDVQAEEDQAPSKEDTKPTPRRRGRPPGSKKIGRAHV